MRRDQLTREQKNAVKVYVKYAPYLDNLMSTSRAISTEMNMFKTNYVSASAVPYSVSKLPKEMPWTWNQSNAKITVPVDEKTQLVIKKVSPRLRSPLLMGPAPSYKIWVYKVMARNQEDCYFLWCEKGVDTNYDRDMLGVNTEIGVVFPEVLSADSLSFLLPFVDGNTARELGWL